MRTKLSTSIALDYIAHENCTFQLNVQAARTPQQRVSNESLRIDGAIDLQSHVDASGTRFVRFASHTGPVTVRYSADVEISPVLSDPASLRELKPNEIPPATLPYVLPSRYCESDKLMPFAREKFGALKPGYGRVAAIVDWVRGNVAFKPGTTNWSTSAWDTFHQRQGVCRDIANLTISLCRADC